MIPGNWHLVLVYIFLHQELIYLVESNIPLLHEIKKMEGWLLNLLVLMVHFSLNVAKTVCCHSFLVYSPGLGFVLALYLWIDCILKMANILNSLVLPSNPFSKFLPGKKKKFLLWYKLFS